MSSFDLSLDVLTEPLTLSQAAILFPSARQNKPLTANAVWRWIHEGVELEDGRVVRLAAVKVAGRWLTSRAAVVRFIADQQPQALAPELHAAGV